MLSTDASQVLKAQVSRTRSQKKELDLVQEVALVKALVDKNCRSVRHIHGAGWAADLLENEDLKTFLALLGASNQDDVYISTWQHIPHTPSIALPDVLLSVLEQAGLGVYVGDLKSENLRFDRERGVCVMVDWDQAIYLERREGMSANEVLDSLFQSTRERFGSAVIGSRLRGASEDLYRRCFNSNGALDVGKTSLAENQETTLAGSGLYHRLDSALFHFY